MTSSVIYMKLRFIFKTAVKVRVKVGKCFPTNWLRAGEIHYSCMICNIKVMVLAKLDKGGRCRLWGDILCKIIRIMKERDDVID